MKLNAFLSSVSNKHAENRLLKFVVIVIGAAVVFNTFQADRALKYQRTVLIPPGLNNRVEVTAYDLSDSYIETVIRHVAGLAFNYSPASVRGQFDNLLTMFSPGAYPDAYRTFYDLADNVEKANVSSVFYLNNRMIIDKAGSQVTIEGQSRKYKGDAKIEDAVKKFTVGYVINNGQMQITRIAPQKEGGK
jgi:conjugal transfer pilus assembly protein TraE